MNSAVLVNNHAQKGFTDHDVSDHDVSEVPTFVWCCIRTEKRVLRSEAVRRGKERSQGI